METNNVCRCCLAQGPHKDLNLTYIWMDEKEIYSEMLLECFNITLSPENASNNICECCVESLRNSLTFKRRVLQSEEELFNRLKEDENLPKVKIEQLVDSDNDSDGDSDFPIDTIIKNEPIIEQSGKRNGQKKKNGKQLKIPTKPPDGDWKVDKLKSLVSQYVIDSTEFPELKVNNKSTIKESLKSKSRKILIKKEPKEKLTKVVWSSKANDKKKHRHNLENILKFSNATPFKNKSLLGYICVYCDATFPDPTNLRSHTEVDHKSDRLNFKTTFDMTDYNVNMDITDLTCTLCDVAIENLTILKEHLVKTHQKFFHDDIKDHVLQFKLEKSEVYNCTMCTSTYETFKMLKQHMNKHYCNYMCNKCDSSFATKRSLNAHKTTHLEGSFKCEYCDKVFSSRPKKHYHEKTKHLGARSISNCPYCDEPFRSYYQRNQHLIKIHNTEAKYKCNICDKTYILKSLLMYHIKKCHLMERNFQCTECGYRFFSKKSLKAHMVKHTGERNYQCEVCNKSYARKYTLREHMRIHNNDRRFKCTVCGTSFVQKCSLKSHLLSNHGISMSAGDITSSV